MKTEPTKPKPLTQRITLECSLEDLAWIMRGLNQARDNWKTCEGSTPLAGGSASILLCALARTRTVRSSLTDAEAKAQRMGKAAA